jgi:glycosyltransferase involved in cell wall biosynthesis
MKILFSLTYYSPYVSGLTLYVKRLAQALVKDGYQVSVIANQHEKDSALEQIIDEVRVVRAKPFLQISKGFLSFDWILKSISQVRKADVVIINLPQMEGFVPALCANIMGKKLIAIYHCEVKLPEGLFNRMIESLLTVSHYFTLFFSHKVVTYTKDYAENSKIFLRFSNKIQYVYPPIPIPHINKRIQNILKKKIGQSDYVIGVAARLASEKGMEYLFEALPLLDSRLMIQDARNKKRITIVIAGSLDPVGEQKYKDRIMKLVEKYNEHIVFLGEVREENMGSFYSLLDVLVLPSVNSTEAFGMVQVEAMMMGVPVVATNLPGVRVPIQKTGMGKIAPAQNSQALGEAIIDILPNRKIYCKNRDIILKEFGIEKTVSFYKKLLED